MLTGMERNNEIKMVRLDDDSINNLFVFLDRVEIKGMKEIKAMNLILDALYQANIKSQEIEESKPIKR